MNAKTKVVFQTYQIARNFRYNLLKSGFGIVIHCKHTPTCGTYLINQVEKRGLVVGLTTGIWRVLRCW